MVAQKNKGAVMMNRVHFDFSGITALVTGGTSGIGYATASLFRASGAHVMVTGTRKSPDEYDDVDLSAMDYRQLLLTDDDGIAALTGSISALDILINNAGANFPDGLDESTPEGFSRSVEVNLLAVQADRTVVRRPEALVGGRGCERGDARIDGGNPVRAGGPWIRFGEGGIAGPDSQSRRQVGGRRHPAEHRGPWSGRDPNDGAHELRARDQTGTARPHSARPVCPTR
jgi:hypothetical protein